MGINSKNLYRYLIYGLKLIYGKINVWVLKISNYSQTCIKRSPLGQRKSGLIMMTDDLLKEV